MTIPTIITLNRTSYACPTQYEGLLPTGEKIYFRFRHGKGRVDVNDKTVLEFGDVLNRDGFMKPRHAMRYIKLAIARYYKEKKK